MAKVKKQFRLEEETVQMMLTLIPFLSSEKNIKLDQTKLIELLVSEKYEELLKRGNLH
jgi:hypothetical protein